MQADLQREEGVALWRQIERQLSEDIATGALQPGSRLPSEHELARRFGVNRHTVRRSIGALEESGLVRVKRGHGTFVQEHVIGYNLGRRTRFSENISRHRMDAGGELLRAEEVPADRAVARALRLRAGSLVYLIETLGKADDRPISMARHFFPRRRFSGLIEVFQEERSVTRTLARLGVPDYTRQITRVTARMPQGDEAERLQQPRNQPVLVTESINVDAEGRPIEYRLSRFASQRVQLVVEPT